ncbi:hypothetical protein [Agathobaculum butyriciproducens]
MGEESFLEKLVRVVEDYARR